MEDLERIKLLERVPVLENKTYDQLEILNKFFEFVRYRPGSIIYKEGDPSNFIGFILFGEVEIKKGKDPFSRVIYLLKSRRGIGFSLLGNQPRFVTAQAVKETMIVQLSRESLEELAERHVALTVYIYSDLCYFMIQVFREITTAIVDNVNLIEYKTGRKFTDIVQEQLTAVYGAEIYRRLSDKWLERLTEYMTLVKHEQGDVLFRENETSDFIGYIVEGEIEVARRRPDGGVVTMGVLNKGMMVGMSVFDDYLQLATATAQTPTTLLLISRNDLDRLKREEPGLALELYRDASSLMFQILRTFGVITAKYLDELPL